MDENAAQQKRMDDWFKRTLERYRHIDLVAVAAYALISFAIYVLVIVISYHSAVVAEFIYELHVPYYWILLKPILIGATLWYVLRRVRKLHGVIRWFLIGFFTLWFSFAGVGMIVPLLLLVNDFLVLVVAVFFTLNYKKKAPSLATFLLLIGFAISFGAGVTEGKEASEVRTYEKRKAAGMFVQNVRLDGPLELHNKYHAGLVEVALAKEFTVHGKKMIRRFKRTTETEVDWKYIPVFPRSGDRDRVQAVLYCEDNPCDDLPRDHKLEGYTTMGFLRKQGEDDFISPEEKTLMLKEFSNHEVEYNDPLIVITPGSLRHQPLAEFCQGIRRDFIWWMLFHAFVVGVHFVSVRRRNSMA